MSTWTPDPTFYPSPRTAMDAPREELAYVAVINPEALDGRNGNSGSAGPTVTAGGLVFIGATADSRLRAYDIETGQQVWEYLAPTSAMSTPTTALAITSSPVVVWNSQ